MDTLLCCVYCRRSAARGAQSIRAAGTFKKERVIVSPQEVRCRPAHRAARSPPERAKRNAASDLSRAPAPRRSAAAFSVTGPLATQAEIRVDGRKTSVLNFCANNYLGLSDHPAIMKAGHDAINSHGMVSVRRLQPACRGSLQRVSPPPPLTELQLP
jgi:hypothetical protein